MYPVLILNSPLMRIILDRTCAHNVRFVNIDDILVVFNDVDFTTSLQQILIIRELSGKR